MVNAVLQVIGFCFGLIGWILAVVTTLMKNWAQNDLEGEAIQTTRLIKGLWEQCRTTPNGLMTCDQYDSFFLGLPTALQVARGCACVSIAFGFFSTVLASFGMECTTFASDNIKMKARMVIIAGVLQFLVGLSIGVAVSWYSRTVLHEYYTNRLQNIQNQNYSSLNSSETMVYGPALFLGWAAMVICCLGGLLQCCASWEVEEEDRGHPFTYNPPRSKTAAEYI